MFKLKKEAISFMKRIAVNLIFVLGLVLCFEVAFSQTTRGGVLIGASIGLNDSFRDIYPVGLRVGSFLEKKINSKNNFRSSAAITHFSKTTFEDDKLRYTAPSFSIVDIDLGWRYSLTHRFSIINSVGANYFFVEESFTKLGFFNGLSYQMGNISANMGLKSLFRKGTLHFFNLDVSYSIW